MADSTAPPDPTEAEKVVFLSRPEVWPHAPGQVEVIETHMSWVFLAGARAYKLKKPVRMPFLDFSTVLRRKRAVEEELRLNRRLSPGVYLGAQALRRGKGGGLTLGRRGRAVDWLVVMLRLPEDRTLAALIHAGRAAPADLAPLADLLSRFYRGLSPAEVPPGRFTARFLNEHRQTAQVLGDPALSLDGAGLARALAGFEAACQAARPLLEARVRAGKVVEGHGDLRPEHVFLTDPPVVIDALEFNLGLRTVDPFDEVVFLGLECARLGADWVFPELVARMTSALDDRPDPRLLDFYWRYRALLRARLSLLHLAEPVLRTPAKWRPLAHRYVLLAGEGALSRIPR